MKFISPRRLITLAWRMRGKPPRTLLGKSAQLANLAWHHFARRWAAYERAAQRRWSGSAVSRFVAEAQAAPRLLIQPDGIAAVRDLLEQHPRLQARLESIRAEVLARKVRVFTAALELPAWNAVPWCADWRFAHHWPPAFYRQYNFYEFDKPAPYDVKFPWELSRLNFLMIPTLLDVLYGDGRSAPTLADVLTSWRRGNPCAASVNWYPMECAMRGVNLVLLASLLVQRPSAYALPLRQLLVLCELHGRFLYRTVEYGDVRGNHFAAQITALALLGLLLESRLPEARRWLAYARRHLDRELLLQYSDDGVQFEKSTYYHRLVSELFLVAAVALDRAGRPLSDAARRRLRAACRYVRAYTRPDGLAPIWGDSDDARALWFEPREARDHRALTDLAAAYFQDPSLAGGDAPGLHAPLLLGSRGAAPRAPGGSPGGELAGPPRYFPDGGMVCVTRGDDYFMADVGSVGLDGHGGHGHLDALSFELMLRGVPLVVDPGSYVYTADPRQRNRFRGTRAHNVAMVDDAEMATLDARHLWRLGAEADPYDVDWEETADGFTLSARHDGYARLADAVRCQRQWNYSAGQCRLQVIDNFQTAGAHRVQRLVHFDAALRVTLTDNGAELTSPHGERFLLRWRDGAQARLLPDWVSYAYGAKSASTTLELTSAIAGPARLEFEIRWLG